MTAQLKIDLIAWTYFDADKMAELTGWTTDAEGASALAEGAGRACYASWNKPNPVTATNAGYLANIMDHQHFSVLEHGSASFYLQGVSRSLTHELVRHRHFSFSQLSQRYVDSSEMDYVVPPAMRGDAPLESILQDRWNVAIEDYEAAVTKLQQLKGMSRKKAREAARALLPNMTETRLVLTGNLRAYRDMIAKRYSIHADAEICELAGLLLAKLRVLAPNVFQDFLESPLS